MSRRLIDIRETTDHNDETSLPKPHSNREAIATSFSQRANA